MGKIKVIFNHPLKFLGILKEDFKASRKGLKRVVPRIGVNEQLIERGRIYKAKGGIILDMKVTRSDGSIENYVVDKSGQRRVD